VFRKDLFEVREDSKEPIKRGVLLRDNKSVFLKRELDPNGFWNPNFLPLKFANLIL
jgi:hypothetical protein